MTSARTGQQSCSAQRTAPSSAGGARMLIECQTLPIGNLQRVLDRGTACQIYAVSHANSGFLAFIFPGERVTDRCQGGI